MSAEPHSSDQGIRVDVLRGSPGPEELAALIAVVSEAYVEEAESAIAEESRRSGWAVSQRALRHPLARELGWRGWTGR